MTAPHETRPPRASAATVATSPAGRRVGNGRCHRARTGVVAPAPVLAAASVEQPERLRRGSAAELLETDCIDPEAIARWLVGLAERFEDPEAGKPTIGRMLRTAAGLVIDRGRSFREETPERPSGCATCGASLPPAAATGRPRRYCGRACRDAARNATRNSQAPS